MDIEIGKLMIAIGLGIRLVWLKMNYVMHDAICLDYGIGRSWVTYPLYEYEILIDGKFVKYRNWGTNCFRPRKGKRCKVLINKNNYDKVIGANAYIVYSILFVFFLCGIT